MINQNSISEKLDSKQNMAFSVRVFGYVYGDHSCCLLSKCAILLNPRLIVPILPRIVPILPPIKHFKRY